MLSLRISFLKAWLEDVCSESESAVSPEVEELPNLLEEGHESQDEDTACEVCGSGEDQMSDEEELRNGTRRIG